MSLLSAKRFSGFEHQLLGLMLFSLLMAIFIGPENKLSYSLLITHFGLFLLWQPILKPEQSFSGLNLFLLTGFVLAFIIWFNLWISVFWMLLLLSLLTGRIFARGIGRAAYGLAVIIIFLELVLIINPRLFDLPGIPRSLSLVTELALLGLLLLLILIPSRKILPAHIDFIRGFFVVILTLFLCMGSVLTTFSSSIPYLQSLAITILIAATFLLATAILWTPRAGFTGLAQLWEKYLLNIGGPFEEWISRLAAIEANPNINPQQFLESSIQHLMNRPWVCGTRWQMADTETTSGKQSANYTTFTDNDLKITLYAYNPIGPALLLHTKLLLAVLSFYYRAKTQEQQLIKQAHLRAIYETGAKLTHDVKNILQSTQTMTQIVLDEDTRLEDVQTILQQQLPLLTQRLKTTLDKLSDPQQERSKVARITVWWDQLKTRYNRRNINFLENIKTDVEIPVDTYDSITENLLENARNKRLLESEIEIVVRLECIEGRVRITVCDTGKAIDEHLAAILFTTPLHSEDGFGIGLYQAQQQARHHHIELELYENTNGRVCFKLEQQT
ncbi:MAG: ATP-binding protein [Gammaproteobacteria bacterium]|nr:ATP-binding protein [Gammaproteobacteria bacterium]